MANIGKKVGKIGLFFLTASLCGCLMPANDDAWPGVSSGTVSSAPEFTAPVAGGQFGQRTPADVLQNQYGYRGEDLSANRPAQTGVDADMNSFDSSKGGSQLAANGFGTGANGGFGANGGYDADGVNGSSRVEETSVDPNDDPADPVEDWLAPEGSSLRDLLIEWGDKSGWRVIWNTDRGYILQAGAMFRGRVMGVASAILRSFARAAPAPWGTFYKGNRVLVVTTQEDENADD